MVAVPAAQKRRSQQLQDRFGPEYTRVLAEQGDKNAAEKELLERSDRHAEFDIRPLDRQARDRYRERWELSQRHFVDAPEGAVGDAHALAINH